MKKRVFYPFLLAVFCLLVMTGCTKTLKLADYVDYKLKGYDGYGVLTDKYDTRALAEAIAKAAGYSEKKSNYEDKLDIIKEDIADKLEVEWSQTDHISRGDTLTCSWEISSEAFKNYKVKLDTSSFKVTVAEDDLKALKDLKATDVLKITPEGYSGAGRLYFSLADEKFKDILYSYEDDLNGYLANGDEFTIELSDRAGGDLKEVLGLAGYKLDGTAVKYTVEGLEEPAKIDPFEFVTVSFEGYSGGGTPKYELDSSASGAFYYLDFNFEPAEKLSNGDTVTLHAKSEWWEEEDAHDILKYYGIVFTNFDKTYTVAGLEEPEKVDPFDFITLNYQGVSGYATLSCEKDSTKDFLENLDVSLDKKESIANGDVITLTLTHWWYEDVVAYCLKEYGVLLTQTEKTITVDSLPDAAELDPFDYVTVTFSGISGDAKAEYAIDTESEYAEMLDDIYFTFSDSRNLTVGQEITLTASRYWGGDLVEYCMKNYGVQLTATEHTYKVEALDEYLSTMEGFPEETLKAMNKEAEDAYAAYAAGQWTKPDTYKGIKYVGYYLLNRKEYSSWNTNSYLYLIYRVSVKTEKDGAFEYYYYHRYDDILVKADGTIDVDPLTYRYQNSTLYKSGLYYRGYATMEDFIKNCVTSYVDNYTYTTDISE